MFWYKKWLYNTLPSFDWICYTIGCEDSTRTVLPERLVSGWRVETALDDVPYTHVQLKDADDSFVRLGRSGRSFWRPLIWVEVARVRRTVLVFYPTDKTCRNGPPHLLSVKTPNKMSYTRWFLATSPNVIYETDGLDLERAHFRLWLLLLEHSACFG